MVCVYLTVARVGLWTKIVSFPGHALFIKQTHMTFGAHFALMLTFVEISLHPRGLSAGSVSKTTKSFANIINPLTTIDS